MINPRFFYIDVDGYTYERLSLIAMSRGYSINGLCSEWVTERCNAIFSIKPKKARKNASRKVQCTRKNSSRKVQCTRAVCAGIRTKGKAVK